MRKERQCGVCAINSAMGQKESRQGGWGSSVKGESGQMMPLTRGRADSAWKEKHQGTQRESEQESTGHTFRSVEAASNR